MMRVELTISPAAARLPPLRRAGARLLHEAGVDAGVAADVLLALDEAVANAIQHGSAGGRPVAVSLAVTDGWVDACVRDQGPSRGLPAPPGAPPPALQAGGRGLWLISRLVDEVHLRRAGTGTEVCLRRRARGVGPGR